MGRLNAGQLNQRVEIITAGHAISDGRGGFLPTADQDARLKVYARVRPLRAAEKLALGQVLNSEVYEVTIRKAAGVTAKQRLEWKGKTLSIQAVTPDEYNECLLLTCSNGGQ